MHLILKEISAELNSAGDDPGLRYRFALARAVDGDALNAAAYAAYSSVYGYGGYAVSDPDSFAEIHRRRLDALQELRAARAA